MAMTFQRRKLRERDAEAFARYIARLLTLMLVVFLRMTGPRRWRRRGVR